MRHPLRARRPGSRSIRIERPNAKSRTNFVLGEEEGKDLRQWRAKAKKVDVAVRGSF
jgi:hypothetical protein